jgi:glycosyltransferase involved in cell wall biosynthesis
VITSTESSLPEITGTEGIARLVSPSDDESLAAAMAEIMADADSRASMSERGIRRAAKFTWEKTARETVAIYQSVLGL